MNSETCAVLASVFPLALITIVLESRQVHVNLRRRRFFREISLAGISTSLVGLVVSVIGVSLGGFSGYAAIIPWSLFAVAVLGMAMIALGITATQDNELEKTLKKKKKDAKRER